ncbi:hypothetical protein [Peribacillus glennii]|uniref:hypothetical protein n=1 Tax=Peribacillus glennii TaxID=2303991 RepID=UPI001314DDAC|nr:hypothetical protein [Peribacillus glennii]
MFNEYEMEIIRKERVKEYQRHAEQHFAKRAIARKNNGVQKLTGKLKRKQCKQTYC